MTGRLMIATAMALVLPLAVMAEGPTRDPGANTEPELTSPTANGAGFVLALDGVPINADPRIEDAIRRTDIALEQADIQITFDGLNPTPRLNVETAEARAYTAGDSVTLLSELNYPAFVTRAEMLIIDRGATGGPRLMATVPVDPNGSVTTVLPAGSDLVVVHRVYDAAGRYDETVALPLFRVDDRALSPDAEEGYDGAATRNIPVRGGAVRVVATNVAPGATVYTLNEAVRPDATGALVIERILPPGEYAVDVRVEGAGPTLDFSRDLEVPGSEWFATGVGDLTFSQGSDDSIDSSVKLQIFADGDLADGTHITASVDTDDELIEDLFSRRDENDPRSVAERLARDDGYPTFGDDSVATDLTPSSGDVYLRVERDGNFALWGDYQARLDGSAFLRNERTLYGAQVHYATSAMTTEGEARASIDLYAAAPDQLVGRDVLRGTGGSLYFLGQRDLTLGTAVVSVETRDAVSGRLIETRQLVEGRDYSINYMQGAITLTSPLSGSLSDGLIVSRPGGDVVVNLVAQYEYTPTGGSVDGVALGGRVEAWVTDDLRFGLTAMTDETGIATQQSRGADLRYEIGANSFVQLDYAETEGPGYDTTFSDDGGFTLNSNTADGGTGSAVRLEGQVDLADMGLAATGVVGGYFEDRTEGFTTLDTQVDETTGDQRLYGLFAEVSPSDRLTFRFNADREEDEAGLERTEIGAEAEIALNDRFTLALGAQSLDETDPNAGTDGSRIDLATRLSYGLNDATTVSVFGQATVENTGLDDLNRYGFGIERQLTDGWAITAEVSDGTGGLGAKALAQYEQAGGGSTYFGYELDPSRAIDAGISPDDNGGRYVIGGQRQISDDLTLTGENSYDIFGPARTLTSQYGVEYTATSFLTYSGALSIGRVQDDATGDFDRTALSFGVRYEDQGVTARSRIEFRRDEAAEGSTRSDVDTIAASADLSYEIDPTRRVILTARGADTNSADDTGADGTFVDVSLGYALRPIDDERLNVLARYRFVQDFVGSKLFLSSC